MTFFSQSDIVPIRTGQVPQNIETSVTFNSAPGVYMRYAYSRSSDSMANQIEGQDYLCYKHNDERFVGVVCDGVGSSFCGNLAARILGDELMEWLWSLDIVYVSSAPALQEMATSYLNKLQKQANIEVQEYEISDEVGGLIRQALEAQRAYGSEAIFAAFRIDHPSAKIPNGLVSVLWMGDTTIRLIANDGTDIDIGGSFENANRWSTAKGVRGVMSTTMRELQGVGRILAHSDGLSTHAAAIADYADDTLDREIRAGARLPTSDDVAFLDVVIRNAYYEGYPDPELPDPNLDRPHLEQIWNPTGGDSYELRWNWAGQGRVSFLIQEATNPALSNAKVIEPAPDATSWKPGKPQAPGHYYYRVRAINRRGVVTPWSELRQTRVNYPPPPAPSLTVIEGQQPTLEWEAEGDALDYLLVSSATADFAETDIVYDGRSTSFAVGAGLKPGTYFFRVRATSDGGEGPWSEAREVEIVMPPPPTPHLAGVSYDSAQDGYLFRWHGVPGAARYELRKRVLGSDEEEIIQIEDTSCTVVGLEPADYLFDVRACHEFGCSAWSVEQSLAIQPPAPEDAPELTLTGPDEKAVILVEWTQVKSADEYRIEIAENPDFSEARHQTQTPTRLNVNRREPGVLHIRVRADNQGGSGPWSEVAQIVIEPKPPGWIEASFVEDNKKISLAWGAVGGRVTYLVESTLKTGASNEIYRGEDTHCTLEPPASNGTVVFRVRTEAPGVHSAWTESLPVQFVSGLEAPRLANPEKEFDGTITLRWNTVDNAVYYLVEVAHDKTFGTVLKSIRADTTSARYQPAGSGNYFFRAIACREPGPECSKPGNVVEVAVNSPPTPTLWPLDPVKALTIFEITWQGVPGCEFYELEESSASDFPVAKTKKVRVYHPSQKLAHKGRPPGRFYYRVRAVAHDAKPGDWSNVLVVDVS